MTSSWLDNIAAHYEEEDEEDYESQPQLKLASQQQQKPSQPQQQQQQEIQSQSQLSHNLQQHQNQQQTNHQPDLQVESEKQKTNIPISTEKKENGQGNPEKETLNSKEMHQNQDKADKILKRPPYSNIVTKEMYKFDKAISSLLKRQEFYYAGSMIKTRSSVDFALERTSKPIQTIGGLGTISLEAKGKYDVLKKRIMNIQPLCSVTPKSK